MSRKVPQGLHDLEVQKQIVAKVEKDIEEYLSKCRNVLEKLRVIYDMVYKTAREAAIAEALKSSASVRDEDVERVAKMHAQQMYFSTISPVESYLLWMYEDLLEIRKYLTALSDMLAPIAPDEIIDRLRKVYSNVNDIAMKLARASFYITDSFIYNFRPVFEIGRIVKSEAPDQALEVLNMILSGKVQTAQQG